MKRLLLLILLLGPIYTFAQNLELDASFAIGTGFNQDPRRIKVQPNGKILACGNFTYFNGNPRNRIIRINTDGSIDPTFTIGSGFNAGAEAMVVQTDGKIVVGGNFTSFNGNSANRIVRLNADGSYDPTFSYGSGFNGQVYRMLIQPDGKIICGGQFSTYKGTSFNCIIRLNPDGNVDPTFNVSTGFSGTQVSGLALQSDGKIIVGGDFISYRGTSAKNLIRLNTDGSVDPNYTVANGPNDGIIDMELQTDGRLIIVGRFTTVRNIGRNGIARLNATGTIDNSFNPGTGMNTPGVFICNLKIGLTGKILIGGTFTKYNGISRNSFCIVNSDGSLNTDVSLGTSFDEHVHTIDIQADGKFIIGGFFTDYNGDPINRIARLILYDWAIKTGQVPTAKCRGDEILVPYTVEGTGTYNPGNLFIAQLSDANGNFTDPTVIGTLPSLTSGTIIATIPDTITPGTGYRIRVVSSNPAIVGTDNGFNIAINPYPDPYISGPSSVCDDATSNYATIAESGVVYQWACTGGTIQGPTNTNAVTVKWSNGSAGTLTLIASFPLTGCTKTVHKDVVIVDPPVAVINGDNPVCEGQTYTYTTNESNDYSYEWTVTGGAVSGSSTASSINVIWAGTSGTITVKVSDKTSGCFSSTSKNITVNPSPHPTITGPSPVCQGDTVTLTTTFTAGHTYLWEVMGGDIYGADNGTSVKVIIGAGPNVAVTLKEKITSSNCENTIVKTLIVNKAPEAEIEGLFDVCYKATEKYQVSSSSTITYNWTVTGGTLVGPNNGASIYVTWPNVGKGKIVLVATNTTTGCKANIEKEITINPLPMVNAGKDTTICVGSIAIIGNYATSGTADYTYLWTPSIGLSDPAAARPEASPLANTQYIVTVTDSKGCTAKDTILVKVNPEVKFTYDGGIVLCQDSVGTIGGVASGGTGAFTYTWEPKDGLSSPTGSTTTIKLNTPGFYTYKLTVKDALGCSINALFGVTILPNAGLTLQSNAIDYGKLDGCTSSKEMGLVIYNKTQSVVPVNSIEINNTEYVLTDVTAPFPLGAGDSIIVPIKYNPTKAGVSKADVTITMGSCSAPLKVKLTGEKLQMLLSAKTSTFNLGKKILCQSVASDTVITISNSGTDVATFDLGKATIADPYAIIDPTGVQTLNPGQTLTITIRFNPTRAGVFNSSILLPFTAGTCKDAIKLTFAATVTEPLPASALSSINFGAMLGCDTYRDSTFVITNNGNADLNITSVGGSEFVTLTSLPITIKPGEKQSITIRYTPQSQGNVTSKLVINSQPCDQKIEIPVIVSKQGVSYSIPDTVDCGDIIYCANKTSETYFNIANNTPASDCEIKTVSVAGEFTSTIAKGSKIITGQSGSYKVTFTPSDATPEGLVYGAINVTVTPCDVSKKIVLKGRKTNVHLQVDSASLNYGSITVGMDKTKQVKLFNVGTATVELQPGDVSTSAPFTVTSTVPALPTILKPGDSLIVNSKFTAIAGLNTTDLKINVKKPCPVDFNVAQKGFGTVLVGRLVASVQDFGDVYLNDVKLDSISIENTGELDAVISNINVSNPMFTLLPGQTPLNLPIGAKKFVKLNFTPTALGPQNSTLSISSDILPISTYVVGKSIERPIVIMEAEVGMADFRVKSGEIFKLPLILTKSKNIDLKRTTGYEAIIKYNKTVMAPYSSASFIDEVKDYQYVTLKGNLSATLGKIGEFEFIGALGMDSCTTITLDTIKWVGLDIPTVYLPGSLCITDICRTCGDRLVIPTQAMSITSVVVEQNGEILNLNFDVNEKAPTKIRLYNLLSELLIEKEILPEDYKNNVYKLNLNGYASGVYLISISNDVKTVMKTVNIGK